MTYDLVKANLNLYAVLTNLEDLVAYDPEMAQLSKDWNISIQFSVRKGPKAFVSFKDGKCTVGRGKTKKPKVKLFFTSPKHLNRMFEEGASPIILKGFTKIGFLLKDFPKLTDRMEYYLKPDDELLKDSVYMELNTRFTLNTAAFALKEIGSYDTIGQFSSSHMRNGTILLSVKPEGPAVNITFMNGDITPIKGDSSRPTALVSFKDIQTANDFLLGKSDMFKEIATGNVAIKGQTSMIDAMGIILDRVPHYLT